MRKRGCGNADAETRMQMRMRKRECGCGPDDEGVLVPRRFAVLAVTGNNRDDGLFRDDQLSLYDASIRFAHRQSLFIYSLIYLFFIFFKTKSYRDVTKISSFNWRIFHFMTHARNGVKKMRLISASRSNLRTRSNSRYNCSLVSCFRVEKRNFT